jgi:alkanesulfonate monooxygenase SsuD/methylene tetrahydromethanopterin reductase-like flavin-dependent oxidoreductase (luciferase family)
MVAIIGGQPHRFKPLIDLYREAGRRAGHAPERLKVGLHLIGYLAETNEQAAEEFFPGYARTFTQIGLERGWPPTTRTQYDALRGPTGALVIGDPTTVVKKIRAIDASLGGISRVTLQMSVAALPHAKALRAIQWLGQEVAPALREKSR